jgi:hypothetical protein
MTIRKTYLRPILLVAAVAAGLALAPPAAARVSQPASHVGSFLREPGGEHPLTRIWRWLSSVWDQEGSSMDPFGTPTKH